MGCNRIDRRENPVSGPKRLPHYQAFARFAAGIKRQLAQPQEQKDKTKGGENGELSKRLAFIPEMHSGCRCILHTSSEKRSGSTTAHDDLLFWQIAHPSGV